MPWLTWKVLIFLSNTLVFKWKPSMLSDSDSGFGLPAVNIWVNSGCQLTASMSHTNFRLLSHHIKVDGLFFRLSETFTQMPTIQPREGAVLGPLQHSMSHILLSGRCHLPVPSKEDLKRPKMRCIRFLSVPLTIHNCTISNKSICISLHPACVLH